MFKLTGSDNQGRRDNRKDFIEEDFSEVIVAFERFGDVTKMWLKADTWQRRAVAIVDRLPYSTRSLTVAQTRKLINTIEVHYARV
tara:strand:- start:485 stop:739 length:255 start_codon:yes stop_codon:yes gene_type:complete